MDRRLLVDVKSDEQRELRRGHRVSGVLRKGPDASFTQNDLIVAFRHHVFRGK